MNEFIHDNNQNTTQYLYLDELVAFKENTPKILIQTNELSEVIGTGNLQFCGNGSEGICFYNPDYNHLYKIFYFQGLDREISGQIINNLHGACENGIFWNANNSTHFSSSKSWHLKALESNRLIGNYNPKSRLFKEIRAMYLGHSLIPYLIDKPIQCLTHNSKVFGYTMPFYSGTFLRLRDIRSQIIEELTLLGDNGILLDYSYEAYNAVMTNEGLRLFDLE